MQGHIKAGTLSMQPTFSIRKYNPYIDLRIMKWELLSNREGKLLYLRGMVVNKNGQALGWAAGGFDWEEIVISV